MLKRPKPGTTRRLSPASWYAIGTEGAQGWFKVRRLVVGRLLARYEKRDGEVLRRVKLIDMGLG